MVEEETEVQMALQVVTGVILIDLVVGMMVITVPKIKVIVVIGVGFSYCWLNLEE